MPQHRHLDRLHRTRPGWTLAGQAGREPYSASTFGKLYEVDQSKWLADAEPMTIRSKHMLELLLHPGRTQSWIRLDQWIPADLEP